MKRKNLWLLAFSIIILVGFVFVNWGSFGRMSNFNVGVAGDGNLNLTLERIRDDQGVPALAAVLIRNGKIVEAGAVGVRAVGYPELVTTGDRWHLGSISKSMTATLAAVLVEEDVINWETTVGEVFPDLAGTIRPEYTNVRLEELLSHTAGLSENLMQIPSFQTSRESTVPIREQRRQWCVELLALAPKASRGTHLYSNANYVVAGAMLEAESGEPWEELMRQHVFNPLGMTSTGFGAPGTVGEVPDEPRGHLRKQGKLWPLQPDRRADNPRPLGPAGTIHTTLADFARYMAAHLTGARDGAGLVSAETFRRLRTPPPGNRYALGWNNREHSHYGGRVLYHNGSNGVWHATVWLAPERDFAILAVTNVGGDAGAKGVDNALRALTDRCNAAFE